jgi:glycosyltransferase involved in cell wall biosynthesis
MKKCLVILTPGFPSDESDTTCLPAVQNFIRAITKFNTDRDLIVLAFQYPYEKRTYTWHGVKVISLGGKNRAGILRMFTWLKAYLELKKIYGQYAQTGLLSLWITECALVAKYFSRGKKIKNYVWVQGRDALKSNKYVKRIRPAPESVIAISQFNQEVFYKNHNIQPGHVIENGVDREAFPLLNSGERPIDIMGAGSLTAGKNYRLFLEVIGELKKTFPHIKCVIAGDGPEKDRLAETARSLGLGNVTFAGLLSHDKVLGLMNNAKIFLHPSDYEGNSSSVIEALYSGCRVIVRQPLSNASVKNLDVVVSKSELIRSVEKALTNHAQPERVLFNSMDDSAKKILQLFDK